MATVVTATTAGARPCAGGTTTTAARQEQQQQQEEVVVKQEPNKGTSNKAKNFTEEEDVMLARACVACTLDPISGTDQKAGTFWASVYQKFQELCEREMEVRIIEERTDSSLENRFKRRIQKECMEWNAIYKAVPLRSGEQESDRVARVNEAYKKKHGGGKNKSFKFLKCMPFLWKLPKFDPNLAKKRNEEEREEGGTNKCRAGAVDGMEEEDVGGSGSNRSVLAGSTAFSKMSCNLQRPVRNKKAKTIAKREAYVSEKIKSRERMMLTLTASLDNLSRAYSQNEEKSFLMSMWKACIGAGQTDLAAEYLSQIKMLGTNNGEKEQEKRQPGAAGTDSSPGGAGSGDAASTIATTDSSWTPLAVLETQEHEAPPPVIIQLATTSTTTAAAVLNDNNKQD